ncbi:MAG: 7-cyano-7-deazaguanine synthase QueC [Candidatus Heimdallarchaeota archaeon]|nr:7-cyano-7-deazaguanine synthase QueC [Candidatus Heimdallarchaeota archaeon]
MPDKKKSAIVLLSGGLDSTVCLWWAKQQEYSTVTAMTFEYGSKEETILVEVTKALGMMASIDAHQFIKLPFLAEFSKLSGSSLSKESKKDLPKLKDEDLDDLTIGLESAKSVWIPARNLVFLSIASSYAEILGDEVDIITGFNLEEGSTFPDNTQEFINDFTRTASRGVLNAKVEVLSPIANINKAGIVQLGKKLEVPFEYSNSCYDPKGFDFAGKPIHCGICESCKRRKRGFKEGLGFDPTIYE